MNDLPQRRTLHHGTPSWVKDGALFFITICTEPRGQNQLCAPAIGPRLLQAAEHCHASGKWWLRTMLLMPDHLHALLAVPRDEQLTVVVRTWKSYQTRTLGIKWQSGFFDHRLRSDESEDQKAEYIRLNPVRAGLIQEPEEWPYVWPRV